MPEIQAHEGPRPTLLESALRSDRVPLLVVLVALPLVCWAWIAVMSRDMYGPMTGASAWMMTPVWDMAYILLLWLMWAVMMAAMMLPSAAPMVLTYGSALRRITGVAAARHVYALAAGYLTAWVVFSAGAAALQRGLAALLLVSPMMELTSPRLGAALLVLAGLYQLTPLKHACLDACRSPLAFLMSRWRPRTSGAFRLGLEHGASCVGCCWALMLLLFIGGVMNLAVIAALTAFVALEKLAPFGLYSTRVSGALLIAAALWMLVR
jgi:predicted metal-binding membrane protein